MKNPIQYRIKTVLDIISRYVSSGLVCSIQASHCICGVLELEVEMKCENTPRI